MTDLVEEDYEEDEDYVCPACNGSGEGMWDGSTCYKCKGTGGYPKQYRYEDE